MNVLVKTVCAKIEEVTTAEGAKVKNGLGVRKLAKLIKAEPADVAEACAKGVERGKLARGKGRGGSFRLADRPHVQNEWGLRTGHVKGTLAAIHAESGYVTTGLKESRGKGQKRPRKVAEAVAPTDGAM